MSEAQQHQPAGFRYMSVCSGLEAATLAFAPLGWEAAVYSDIDDFPRKVLRHRWPNVPLHGRDRKRGEDMDDYAKVAGFQTIKGKEYGRIDLICGGTPCQDMSVAGGRKGLDGPRYKALGNSWGVPVFEWVGSRIDMMNKILKEKAA